MDAHQRHIVIAVDFQDRDDMAMRFLLDSLWQPGTVVNLVHVVLAKEEYNEVYHGFAPGGSVDVRDPAGLALEDAAVSRARSAIAARYAAEMDKRDIAHNLHLFLDTVNAPAKAIFDTVNGVCKQLNAEVLVMAANHKSFLDRALGYSVHSYALDDAEAPVMVFV